MKYGFHLLMKIGCWFWKDLLWADATSCFKKRRSIQNFRKCFFGDSNDNKVVISQEFLTSFRDSALFLLNSMMLRSAANPVVIDFNGRKFSTLVKPNFWSCLQLKILLKISCLIIKPIKLLTVETNFKQIFKEKWNHRGICLILY